MLVDCEVWVCGDGTVWRGGCGWCEQHLERRTIDTNLYEWFGNVGFVKESSIYPYHGQCNVPHKDRYKSALCIDVHTLRKIRELLGADKAVVIE